MSPEAAPSSPEILGLEMAVTLKSVLDKHKEKRVVILAVPSAGKTTLVTALQSLGVEAKDMDTELFPKMSRQERDFALEMRLNEETRKREKLTYDSSNESSMENFHQGSLLLSHLAKERLTSEPGVPLFSTMMLPADVAVYLHITDDLLKERIQARGEDRPQQFEHLKSIQGQIEASLEEAEKEGVIVEKVELI